MTAFPERGRGRPSATATARYEAELLAFCREIRQIASGLDFKVSSRGWCYILENRGDIAKGDFDAAQRLINDCRKTGLLPLDICAEDEASAVANLEALDETDPGEEAEAVIDYLDEAHLNYTPFSFFDDLDVYVEMLVEKVDLKNLFEPVCAEFRIPIANGGGWTDINTRAAVMRRFKDQQRAGKQCVLLWCGDHDPGGLNISNTIRSNFADLAGAVGWRPDELIIDRFGLNSDFIKGNGLIWINNLETGAKKEPGKPNRLDDPNHRDHNKPYVRDYIAKYGVRKVEANALVVRPKEGRELCRQAILKYVPATAPKDYARKLAAEREIVRQTLRQRLEEIYG
jgi:hypothetical protein